MDRKANVIIGTLGICVLVIAYSVFCIQVNKGAEMEKKVETDMYEYYDNEIENLRNEIEEVRNENRLLAEDLETLKNELELSKVTVEEDLLLDSDEIYFLEKFVAYFCKEESDSTKIYVCYVVLNRIYEQHLPLSDVVDSFGVDRSNLNAVEVTNEDIVVRKVLNLTHEEILSRSSGAIYFFEKDKIQENELETLLLLFKSGKYTFYTDLAKG